MDDDILKVSVIENLKEAWRNIEATDLEFVKQETLGFCKNQVIKNSIMESVDLAISAAGQTIYELCALGVPTIAIQSAENQSSNIDELSRLGAIYSIKSSTYHTSTAFLIRTLIYDYNVRKSISSISKRLLDGKGPERVAKHILKYGF